MKKILVLLEAVIIGFLFTSCFVTEDIKNKVIYDNSKSLDSETLLIWNDDLNDWKTINIMVMPSSSQTYTQWEYGNDYYCNYVTLNANVITLDEIKYDSGDIMSANRQKRRLPKYEINRTYYSIPILNSAKWKVVSSGQVELLNSDILKERIEILKQKKLKKCNCKDCEH